MNEDITPELLLRAYAGGIFPMAESRDDPEIFWVDPERRGIFPLENFHISRRLARRIRQKPFDIRTNSDFLGVVDACADRSETWINEPIRSLYKSLHEIGHAQSLELWEGPELVGGVYGVTLGAAFFGESMFSRRTDASKIALAHLVEHLNRCGFILFDTQFLTPHLASLGAIEIGRAEYRGLLNAALRKDAEFLPYSEVSSAGNIQRKTQTS